MLKGNDLKAVQVVINQWLQTQGSTYPDLIEQSIDALRKAGWLVSEPLPIEDAPKDGTVIYAGDDKGGKELIFWQENNYRSFCNDGPAWYNAHEFTYDDGGDWRFPAEITPTYFNYLPQPTPSDVEGGV